MRFRLVLSIGAIAGSFFKTSGQQTSENLQKYTLTASGINASYIGYGARLTNLYVNDKNGTPQDIVLGYDQGSGYIHDTEHEHTFFGAVSTYSPSLPGRKERSPKRKMTLTVLSMHSWAIFRPREERHLHS